MNCPQCGGEDYVLYPDPFDYGQVYVCGGCGHIEPESRPIPWAGFCGLLILVVWLAALALS